MGKEASASRSTGIRHAAPAYQLVPGLHVSQNGDRAQVLGLLRERLGGCGYIKSNGPKDRALVYVVRKRADLLDQVIPFFERSPLLSSKQEDFERFAEVVRGMAQGRHRTAAGFQDLLSLALSMNGGGRFRKVRWPELISNHPESSETACQTGA